ATKLSPAAQKDLDSLKSVVRANLAHLDREATMLATLSPLMPFAPDLVALAEARIRVDDIDAERAAGVLDRTPRELAATRARINAGIGGTETGVTPLRVSRDQAADAAIAAETLRGNLANWFTFYNGYDPLFTWWMNLPYKHIDDGLRAYAAF